MTWRRYGLALLASIAGVVCGLLVESAEAQTAGGSVTRTSGSVTATLSWKGGEFGATAPRLAITRDGVAAADLDVSDVCKPGGACTLVEDSKAAGEEEFSILHVADLDGDGEPEVMFDTYSGGAHCCITQRIYGLLPARGTYRRRASVSWGNTSYGVKDLGGDGRFELVGNDDVFAYAFASYAGSWFPPKVLAYGVPAGGSGAARLTDVTRRFPALVRENAAAALKVVRSVKKADPTYEVQGALAGYVADQYLLGRASVARAELARARSRKLVRPGFQTELLTFLKRAGYR